MPKNIVILTGSELRHQFFRKAIAASEGIRVLKAYCEGLENNLRALVEAKEKGTNLLELAHLDARNQSEEDFFSLFCQFVTDNSHPMSIRRGGVNDTSIQDEISCLAPDLLIAYGCSIVKEPLLSNFHGRFLNVHLGLSPYYRGSGTNFWPLVNGEPEYVGATFMHIDAGVDTGEVIHQIRARIFPNDSPHQIGNRLIGDMTRVYADIIRNFEALGPAEPVPHPPEVKYYRKKDFTAEALKILQTRFQENFLRRYWESKEERWAKVPIVEHSKIKGVMEIE